MSIETEMPSAMLPALAQAWAFPQLDGDSDAQVDAEVEQIRRNLVAHITPLRSRSCWPRRRRVTEKVAQTGHPNRALAGRPLAASLGRFSRHEIPKQLDWISVKGAGNRNKFNDVNAALAAFVFGDKRLRPAKLFGQGLLPNARGMSHCDKDRNEPCIFRRFEGLLHVPPGLRIGGKQSDPGIGLSQNPIILLRYVMLPGPSGSALDFGAKRSALAVLIIVSNQTC
jgi:hypothetical protein